MFCISLTVLTLVLVSCGGDGKDTTAADTTDTLPPESVTTAKQSEDTTLDITTEAPKKEVYIHSIGELNTETARDSHALLKTKAGLEPDFRTYKMYRSRELNGCGTAYYPRIKQLKDGSYILFYQDGRWGPNCYVTTSTDLENWEKPQPLFEQFTIDGKTVDCCTTDAAVLKNGDIIAVCCFKGADPYYAKDNKLHGLLVRRSKDGGKTWTDKEIIYIGNVTWEPSVLQLESGEVQIYFTMAAPYLVGYQYTDLRSGSAGLLRSFDNGETWTPKVDGAPYLAEITVQTQIGTRGGGEIVVKDQMPVAIELHTGAIAVATEVCDMNQKFYLTLSYSYDNWAEDVKMYQNNPADKNFRFTNGLSPYLDQFESGETVLSYTYQKLLRLRVGDANGKNFTNEYQLNPDKGGFWGMVEVIGGHKLVAIGGYQPNYSDTKTVTSFLLQNVVYLNHTLFPKSISPVIDGDGSDWDNNTDALFLGSKSQAQTSFRFSQDKDNYYFLIETLDEDLSKEGDETMLYFTFDREDKNHIYRIECGANGKVAVTYNETGRYNNLKGDLTAVCNVVGNVGETGKDTGYVCEVAIPKALIGGGGDDMLVFGTLKNKDGKNTFENNNFIGSTLTNKATWYSVVFQ